MPGRVKLTSTANLTAELPLPKRKLVVELIAVPPSKRTKSADDTSNDSSPSLTSTKQSTAADSTPSTIPPSSQPVSASSSSKKRAPSKPRTKKYDCTHEGCDKSFTRPCRLEEHMRSHSGERIYKCDQDPEHCDKSFLRESHLKAHIKAIHVKIKPYKCTFQIPMGQEDNRGEFGFKRKASEPAEGGEDEETGMKECGASFPTNQHLKRHIESHLKTFPYICKDYPPCTAGFRKKGPLARHVRSEHMGVKPWACPHKDIEDSSKPCPASFDTKGKLGNHVATLHNGLARRRYICTLCVTASPSVPEQQQPTSTTSPPSNIPRATTVDLDRPPTNPSTEDATLLLNLSQASFPVIQAPVPPEPSPESLRSEGMLGFTTHAELRTHISIAHPPICIHCGYAAKRQGDLRKHLREKHELSVEERSPWVCAWEGCGQGFTKKSNLTTHTATVHQGLKPFLCEYPECRKRFGHKAVLTRHITAKHTEKKAEAKVKKPRKKRTRAMGLAEMLTGYGYEESGRDIICAVQGCPYRFSRLIDLRRHLGAQSGHALGEVQVEELMKLQEKAETRGKKAKAKGKKVDIEPETSESEWSIAGSDTEDEYEVYQFDDDE
ncbi:hypothetical protein FN846DRAFT_968651 [Sphaerosporella brunnea]|uniref:C2H2-type domain-containing protein n=1 Tax=Sphaerosporella brunnea TaxID=1250544 RepID=A0A5J5EJ06_9PEZI|nr:hypothetical protein FN846DRAFT_968651 [Sphaerosporella brunnea]